MITIILLFGLGMALVVAEVFIPSMGVLGMAAGLSLMTSIGMAFYEDPGTGTLLLVITAVTVPIILTFGIKLFPRTPLGRKITARGFSFEDGRAVDRRDEGLAGARGIVEAQLRPADRPDRRPPRGRREPRRVHRRGHRGRRGGLGHGGYRRARLSVTRPPHSSRRGALSGARTSPPTTHTQ